MSPFLTFRALPVGSGYWCFIDSFHQESLCFDSYSDIIRFFCEIGGGGGDDELSFQFIVLLLHGLSCDFIVVWGE